MEWHGPSQPLVDRFTALGYECEEIPNLDHLMCTYPGAGSIDLGEFGGVLPYGIGIQDRQNLQLVLLMTDDPKRVGEALAALTSAQMAAWAVDRFDVLVSSLEAYRSSGETADDGLPSCRTLDTAVLDLAVDFNGGVPILAAMLRPFDQPGWIPLPWMAPQENCPDQPMLQPGASADSPCEEAILAYVAADSGGEERDVAFEELFTTCTRPELETFNSKLTNDWQVDWLVTVDWLCEDAEYEDTEYRGTTLCQSCCPDQPILQPGASADSPCERAILAWLETNYRDREASWAAFEELFTACTRSELEAFNSKLAAGGRFAGGRIDWPAQVDPACEDAEYRDTTLCQSCPTPDGTWDPQGLPEKCR